MTTRKQMDAEAKELVERFKELHRQLHEAEKPIEVVINLGDVRLTYSAERTVKVGDLMECPVSRYGSDTIRYGRVVKLGRGSWSGPCRLARKVTEQDL